MVESLKAQSADKESPIADADATASEKKSIRVMQQKNQKIVSSCFNVAKNQL